MNKNEVIEVLNQLLIVATYNQSKAQRTKDSDFIIDKFAKQVEALALAIVTIQRREGVIVCQKNTIG